MAQREDSKAGDEESAAAGDEESAAARVEHRIKEWAQVATRELVRSAERTREELEDIWAEAQNLRRGR